jgi:hypothetical protein
MNAELSHLMQQPVAHGAVTVFSVLLGIERQLIAVHPSSPLIRRRINRSIVGVASSRQREPPLSF